MQESQNLMVVGIFFLFSKTKCVKLPTAFAKSTKMDLRVQIYKEIAPKKPMLYNSFKREKMFVLLSRLLSHYKNTPISNVSNKIPSLFY